MSIKTRLKSTGAKVCCLLFVPLTIVSSCKKKDKETEPANESVTINGSAYTTVKIGNQIWTSVNYNGAGGVSNSNDPAYGKLYTRQEAQAIVLQDGWRLPSQADFEKLVTSFPHETTDSYILFTPEGLTQILSSSGWRDKNGSNASGFNALPAGIAYIDAGGNNDFRHQGIETQFISTTNELVQNGGTERTKTWALFLHSEVTTGADSFTDFTGGVSDVVNSDWYRYSVRFVKDIK